MRMTEEQIERQVERRFDALDARLMAGTITQAEYDAAAAEISRAADAQYRSVRPGPSLVSYEVLPDGTQPVRLSFQIKCF